jgi:predicted transposase YbfD/YdcC
VGDKRGELSAAPAVLGQLELRGRVVTGDALYAARALCRQVVAAGGDYFFFLKGNRSALHADIALLFAEPPSPPASYTQRDRHGDRREVRRLQASTELNEYSDWPHLGQVCRIDRAVTRGGLTRWEVGYAITSLSPRRASPRRLLALARGHWAIENRLHYVRDVTMGEDASQVRSGAAPEVMAALRNTALGLLRRATVPNVAEALRRHARHPHEALALLGIPIDPT